jgi:hypothetical protein
MTETTERIGDSPKCFKAFNQKAEVKSGRNCLISVIFAGKRLEWFRGGLVSKGHRLCVSLNFRLESNKEQAGWRGDLMNQRRMMRAACFFILILPFSLSITISADICRVFRVEGLRSRVGVRGLRVEG